MNHKIQSDEKEYAEVLATMLQNGASYLDVQISLMEEAKEYDMGKVRKHLEKLVSKDLLIQHDLEIELERLSYRNHHPKADAAFGEMIKNIHADLENEGVLTEQATEPKRKIFALSPTYKWAIAAVFLVLLGVISIWKMQTNTPSETLFADYFEPFPDQYTSVIEKNITGYGAALNLDRLETQKNILATYSKGDYEKTIALSESFFEKYPPVGLAGDDEIKLYLGISYLAQNQLEKAIELLEYLTDNSDFPMLKATEWYLALAYIRQHDFERAKGELRNISEDHTSEWQTKARELLEKLG